MSSTNFTKIYLNNELLTHFVKFELHQKINEHHTFDLVLDNEYFNNPKTKLKFKPEEFIGKNLLISLKGNDFSGIVTAVDFELNQEYGYIKLKGYSRTILLESGSQLKSWSDVYLTKILEDVVNVSIVFSVNPIFKSMIEYQAQYKESNFRFLQRLAKQYNEWLYYDGSYLFFGKPKEPKKEIELKYPNDISDLKIKVQMQPVKREFAEYSFMENQMVTNKTEIVPPPSSYMSDALSESLELFPKYSSDFPDRKVDTIHDMKKHLEDKLQSTQASFDIIEVKTNKKELNIGSVVCIKNNKKYLVDCGDYMIIEISHYEEQNQEYYNIFKAIPAGVKCLPEPDLPEITASPQRALVVDNRDPKGRVKVRMEWQNNGMTTNWIQVISPDAGSSKNVDKNRGFVFIPEIGDEVLVGFKHNDPNRPFVMGSLFNSQNMQNANNNNIKSIITKSGNNISLNDENQSISITNPSGSQIILQKNGNISIHAPNTLTLSATDINLNANNSINLKAEPQKQGNGTINIIAQKEIEIHSQKETISVNAEKDIDLKSDKNKVTINAKTEIKLQSENNLNIKGKSTEIKGEKVLIKGGNDIKIESPDTDIF
ncbi:MAG: DUF2345 domain-containing protein [Tenacibaculum sp.]|nr:DUF2345 domain-containing protein [Tenacibaculum sp.]